MKIGIIGGRDYDDQDLVEQQIDRVLRPYEDDCKLVVFLGGGSKGAERIAQDHITGNLGLDYVLFKPYNFIDTRVPHDPKYFHFRNKQIVDNSDMVIVFDDGIERGLVKTILYLKNSTPKDYHIFNMKDGTCDVRIAEEVTTHVDG